MYVHVDTLCMCAFTGYLPKAIIYSEVKQAITSENNTIIIFHM